jgi:DNA invertase Pin-like site-specific DNA recombinase
MSDNRKPAVGYVRMSTDQQQDSPARQRQDIEALASRQGFRIIRWYEDHGQTGTESSKRREFQKLLADAKAGTFQAVLLSEQSRMSREDIFDAMQHWRLFRDAGVSIITCQRGELKFDNLGGVITAIVDQYGAREESVKLAQRVASGLRLKAKQGQRIGGMVFGYDREVIDDTGRVVKRVHFRERFRKPITWRTRLVPSADAEAVAAVKWAFAAVRQGKTVGAVVRELQDRKLLTVYGNPFDYGSTLGLLTNPTYAGTLRAGVDSRAKFCALATDGLIVVENAHEPIVLPEQFEEVQRILASRKQQHDRVPGRHTLAGMVTCGHCGRRMSGVHRKDYNHGEGGRFYHCNPSPLKLGYDPICPHPAVRADRLEAFVLEAIRTHLIDAGAEERIRAAIVRSRSKQATQTSQDERRLAEVRRKIARGTENLALADRDDFAGISKLLEEWRAEETRLVEQIERRKDGLKPLPEALRVIARFAEYRDQLQKADRVALANALRVTVAAITIRVQATRTGGIDHNEYAGELRFHPGFGLAGPVAIPDEAIGYRKIWREIATLARDAGGPIRLADVMRHIGSEDPSLASYHVRRAIKAGVLKKLGRSGGWIAI